MENLKENNPIYDNIFELQQLIESGIYEIKRNANAKMLFAHIALQTTRLLHQKK